MDNKDRLQTSVDLDTQRSDPYEYDNGYIGEQPDVKESCIDSPATCDGDCDGSCC
jgi:hypothetical protein